jgi:uncharacterized protein YecT (DUF1311 family)
MSASRHAQICWAATDPDVHQGVESSESEMSAVSEPCGGWRFTMSPDRLCSGAFMTKFTAIVLTLLLAPGMAQAASFDCDKASAADEKAICDNRALNDFDVRMATMFELGVDMAAMGERDSIKSAQTKWLEQRAACGGDLACLSNSYKSRLADLQKLFGDFDKRAAP